MSKRYAVEILLMTQVVMLIENIIPCLSIFIEILLNNVGVTHLETIYNLIVRKISTSHVLIIFSEDKKKFQYCLIFSCFYSFKI